MGNEELYFRDGLHLSGKGAAVLAEGLSGAVASGLGNVRYLNFMVDDIKPHIIGITESWANNDITDAELGLEGYVMFRKDRMGRRGGGVLLYIKETIPT